MKRARKDKMEVEVSHCKLFKDDIQEIVALMTFDKQKPVIESGEYEFEDEDDLFEYLGTKGQQTLSIKNTSRRVWLHTLAGTGGVRIVAYSNETDALALLHRVSDIVRQREIKKSICESNAWMSLSVGLISGGLGGGFFSLVTHTRVIPLIGASMIAIGNFGIVARMIARSHSKTYFYGVRQHDRKNFWQRKGDDLMEKGVIALVSAIFGAFGTLAVQTLLKK